MRALLRRLIGPPTLPGAATARAIEEALRDDEVVLSRRERRRLRGNVMRALEQIGYRFGDAV